MIRPEPLVRANAAALVALVDGRLEAVTYHYLPSSERSGYAGGKDGVDADLTAVVLDFVDRGPTVITWAMRGELEGLAVLDDGQYSGAADGVVDAADRRAWREHVDENVESVGAAWQVSGDSCPESLWAVRLDFSTGSTVVALGTADQAIDYMPDELVVVSDASLASSYSPRHVSTSSWGDRIEPA